MCRPLRRRVMTLDRELDAGERRHGGLKRLGRKINDDKTSDHPMKASHGGVSRHPGGVS